MFTPWAIEFSCLYIVISCNLWSINIYYSEFISLTIRSWLLWMQKLVCNFTKKQIQINKEITLLSHLDCGSMPWVLYQAHHPKVRGVDYVGCHLYGMGRSVVMGACAVEAGRSARGESVSCKDGGILGWHTQWSPGNQTRPWLLGSPNEIRILMFAGC